MRDVRGRSNTKHDVAYVAIKGVRRRELLQEHRMFPSAPPPLKSILLAYTPSRKLLKLRRGGGGLRTSCTPRRLSSSSSSRSLALALSAAAAAANALSS